MKNWVWCSSDAATPGESSGPAGIAWAVAVSAPPMTKAAAVAKASPIFFIKVLIG